MANNSNYTDVMLEEMNGKFDRIIEVVEQLDKKIDEKSNQSDVENIASDVKVIKAAITDTSMQVHKHEKRITALESA